MRINETLAPAANITRCNDFRAESCMKNHVGTHGACCQLVTINPHFNRDTRLYYFLVVQS